jgi:hypothetical protein
LWVLTPDWGYENPSKKHKHTDGHTERDTDTEREREREEEEEEKGEGKTGNWILRPQKHCTEKEKKKERQVAHREKIHTWKSDS